MQKFREFQGELVTAWRFPRVSLSRCLSWSRAIRLAKRCGARSSRCRQCPIRLPLLRQVNEKAMRKQGCRYFMPAGIPCPQVIQGRQQGVLLDLQADVLCK